MWQPTLDFDRWRRHALEGTRPSRLIQVLGCAGELLNEVTKVDGVDFVDSWRGRRERRH